MPWITFNPAYPNIVVDNTDPALHQKLLTGLRKIEAMRSGAEMLAEIGQTMHRLEIKPIKGGGGSSTGYATGANYVLLAQAIRTNNAVMYKNELTAALGNAQRGGVTKEHLARQIALGLAPAEYVGAKNLTAPALPASVTSAGPRAVTAHLDASVQAATKLIDDVLSGQGFSTRPKSFDDTVQRVLRHWLTRGRGCAADIEINVERPNQCWSDGSRTLRYPTICLAHELVHAWRGMTGRMLQVGDADTHNDIEEVITTGLPPYNFEKYSENIFRSQFQDDPEMGMRTSY